jgi:hypothetical protein
MAPVSMSQAVSSQDTSIAPMVIFDAGDLASNYYVYITRQDTGERSNDLGFAYDSNHPNWSRSYTFSGLTQGTTYDFQAEVTGTNGGSTTYLYASMKTTGTIPSPPTDRISMVHSSSSGKTINMQVLNTYGATSIQWNTPWGTYTRSVSSTPYIESFTAPAYGTEYTIGAIGQNSAGSVGEKLSNTMTEPDMPSISSGGSSNNTITVNVSVSGGWSSIDVEMWTSDGASKLATRSQGYNGSQSFSVSFGGLVANASYLFRAIAYKTASYGGYSPNSGYGGWLTIKNNVLRPANWLWTTGKDANGHKVSGANYSMLASEWNAFTTRINDFRKFRDLTDYSFTTAYSGNNFMYYMFNEAKTAIDAISATGVLQKTTGNSVLASDFNRMMDTLNSIQ